MHQGRLTAIPDLLTQVPARLQLNLHSLQAYWCVHCTEKVESGVRASALNERQYARYRLAGFLESLLASQIGKRCVGVSNAGAEWYVTDWAAGEVAWSWICQLVDACCPGPANKQQEQSALKLSPDFHHAATWDLHMAAAYLHDVIVRRMRTISCMPIQPPVQYICS